MPILLQGYSTASTRSTGLLLRSTERPTKDHPATAIHHTIHLPPALSGFGGDPNSAGVVAIRCPDAGRCRGLAPAPQCETMTRVNDVLERP